MARMRIFLVMLIVILVFLLTLASIKIRNLNVDFNDSIVVSNGLEVWTVDISPDGCPFSGRLFQGKKFLLQPCYAPVLEKILAPTHEVTYQEPQPLHPLILSPSVQRAILPIIKNELTWPAGSPNGKYIAFLLPDPISKMTGPMRKLVIIDSSGSSVLFMGDHRCRLCAPEHAYGHRPAWLPDSSGVICDVGLDKEYLILFRSSEEGGMKITRLGEGFAPAVSSNGTIAFYLRDNSTIKICTGLLNMSSLTIESVKVPYKSKKILDHLSPAWSRQNSELLFFLEDWTLSLFEGEKLRALDTSTGRVFSPDKKGVLKYAMHFGFDTLPKGYTTKTSASK